VSKCPVKIGRAGILSTNVKSPTRHYAAQPNSYLFAVTAVDISDEKNTLCNKRKEKREYFFIRKEPITLNPKVLATTPGKTSLI